MPLGIRVVVDLEEFTTPFTLESVPGFTHAITVIPECTDGRYRTAVGPSGYVL